MRKTFEAFLLGVMVGAIVLGTCYISALLLVEFHAILVNGSPHCLFTPALTICTYVH